jgi:hypothetical protein
MTRFLMLAALALLTATTAGRAARDEDKLPAVLENKPLEPAKGDDEERKLLKERYNAALAELRARYQRFEAGNDTLDALFDAARRVLDSELELCGKAAERVAVREKYLELAREVEKIQQARVDAGRAGAQDLEQARYLRIDAQLQLLRAKKAAEAKPK